MVRPDNEAIDKFVISISAKAALLDGVLALPKVVDPFFTVIVAVLLSLYEALFNVILDTYVKGVEKAIVNEPALLDAPAFKPWPVLPL